MSYDSLYYKVKSMGQGMHGPIDIPMMSDFPTQVEYCVNHFHRHLNENWQDDKEETFLIYVKNDDGKSFEQLDTITAYIDGEPNYIIETDE